MRSPSARTTAAGLLVAIVCGCSDAESQALTYTEADSVGMRVVTSLGPAWEDGSGWIVEPEPSVSIGVVEGEDPYLLDDVMGATRLPDGRILILNAGDGQLRYYGPDGVFLKSEGGLGQGPGEFERPSGLHQLADGTLLVSELFGWKSSRLDVEGEYLDGSRLDNGRLGTMVDSIWGCPERPDARPDGSYVGCAGSGIPKPQVPGMDRVSHWLFRTTHDAAEVDTVGVTYGPTEGLRLTAFGSSVTSGGDPLEIFAGDPASFEITRWTEAAGIGMLIRYPDGLRPVGAAERGRYLELIPDALDAPGSRLAPTFPGFAHLARDAEGHLWATKYEARWESSGGAWIFSPRGFLLGDVDLPSRFKPLEIGADYVLGVATDELGVQRVELYELERRGSG